MLEESLPAFRRLRELAIDEIPRILENSGGWVSKSELHRRLKSKFVATNGSWPAELNEIGRAGITRGSNSIAWALATLTTRMVIHPCSGENMVRLRQSGSAYDLRPQVAKTHQRASPGGHAKIERTVEKNARSAMRRAAGLGLPFDASFVEDSIAAVREADYCCAVSGRHFDIEYRTKGAGGTHYAPSPDRIVPERGYVRGNVRWVLWVLNRGKGEMPADQFLEVCRLVASHAPNSVEVTTLTSRPKETENTKLGEEAPARPSRQQLAAFKAHLTIVKKDLPLLTGKAKSIALEKLSRYEALLASFGSEA